MTNQPLLGIALLSLAMLGLTACASHPNSPGRKRIPVVVTSTFIPAKPKPHPKHQAEETITETTETTTVVGVVPVVGSDSELKSSGQ
jgi:hypothetical protein